MRLLKVNEAFNVDRQRNRREKDKNGQNMKCFRGETRTRGHLFSGIHLASVFVGPCVHVDDYTRASMGRTDKLNVGKSVSGY